MSHLIALLTDFGITDVYVGVMKGVMLGIAPDLRFVDLTHAIQPQNVRQAAFTLLNNYRFFPPDTVFLVVVDPGVGSTRKPLAARSGSMIFVAPDNGVLSYTLRELGTEQLITLDKPAYHLPDVSSTFHGRDVFAPSAALLAGGTPFEQLGSPLDHPVTLPEPVLRVKGPHISGEVMHIDHFGNAVTSIGMLNWVDEGKLTLKARFGARTTQPIPAQSAVVTLGGYTLQGIQRTYGEVARGSTLALVGSSGYLELAVNQGSFAARSDVKIGDAVEVQIG